MKFALIPHGRFIMGSPDTEPDRWKDEEAVEVRLTQSYFMGIHPITREQWMPVMKSEPWLRHQDRGSPSSFGSPNSPVTGVSWEDALDFCKALRSMEATESAP